MLTTEQIETGKNLMTYDLKKWRNLLDILCFFAMITDLSSEKTGLEIRLLIMQMYF